VNISPTASCSNIGIELDTPGQTSYTFDPMTNNSGALASGGTIAFVCSLGSGFHCNSGMKVTVTVNECILVANIKFSSVHIVAYATN